MCRQLAMCLFICIFLIMTGCSSPPRLFGYLYAFSNDDITITDLNTGKIIAHIMAPKMMNFRYATKIDDQRILLIGSITKPNGRKVNIRLDAGTLQFASGKLVAWIYDRFAGTLTRLTLPADSFGINMPTYLPKYRRLIFYCKNMQLCQVSMDTPNNVSIIDSNDGGGIGGYGYYPIVLISDDEVIYATNNNIARYYNLATDRVGNLPLDHCIPQLWRTKTHQLLCFAYQPGANYYFVNLDGTGKISAEKFDGSPIIYLPNDDAILVTGPQLKWHFPSPIPHEWNVLRSYDLINRSVHEFGSGAWAGQGDIAWFHDVPKEIPGVKVTPAASAVHH